MPGAPILALMLSLAGAGDPSVTIDPATPLGGSLVAPIQAQYKPHLPHLPSMPRAPRIPKPVIPGYP